MLTCPSAGRSKDTVNIPTGVAIRAEGELSDLGRVEAQGCGHSCLAKSISDRETKPQNLADPLHVPRAHFLSPSQSWQQAQEDDE